MDLMDLDPVTNDALYSPLDGSNAFRLMVLHPGQRHDPIVTELHAVPAHSVPEYDALSYVWGDPHAVVPIRCNGLATFITVNLHAALVQVRSLQIPRVLWADALCINQKDMQERSQQVAIMGRIYSNARLVLACMGTSGHDGAVPIAALLADYAHCVRSVQPPLHDTRWIYFMPLLQNPWFTRAWVLQEVGLARNPRVVYDDVEFSYRDLMAVVQWLTAYDSHFANTMGIENCLIHTLWTDWSEGNWNRGDVFRWQYALLDLLDHGSVLQCRDPRDHIYAFLGHPLAVTTAGSASRAIVPDYQKDVIQVYREVTLFLLHRSGIRTLSSAEHDAATLADVSTPSWVVRWDVGYTTNNINMHPWDLYQSCGSRYTPQWALDRGILQLQGVHADTIKDVYQIDMRHDNYEILFTNQATQQPATLDELLRYTTNAAVPSGPSYPLESTELALLRTLCINRIEYNKEADFERACAVFLDRHCARSQTQHQPGMNQAAMQTMSMLWSRMMTACPGRTLILTEKGRFGLAPHCSRTGDACCVLYGGSVPFLLRSGQGYGKDAASPKVRLVGETYVHGLMLGEAIDMLERGEATEHTFRIF